MKIKHEWLDTDSLETDKDFECLYSRKEKLIETISADMRENGYDEALPIICCELKDKDGHKSLIVIDGHTRWLAAKKTGLQKVLVSVMVFPNKNAALLHAIHYQRDRRNMSDADIYICTGIVDKRKPRGGDRRSESAKSKTSLEVFDSVKSSAQETAEIVGTSKTKIERVRYIRKNADEQTKQEVREGKKTINLAYKKTQAKRKKSGLKNGNPASVDSVIETITKQMDKIAHKISEQIEAGNNIKTEVYRALVRSYEDLQDEMVRLEKAVGVEAKRETARVLE